MKARLKILLGQVGNRYQKFADEEEYDGCEICDKYLIKIQDLLDYSIPTAPSSLSEKLHTSSSELSLASISPRKEMTNSTPLSIDMVFLKRKISEGMNSSGKSVIMDALFTGANTRDQINVKVKIFHRRDLSRAQNEYKIMSRLHIFDSNRFVRPYGFLDGSRGQIESDHAEDDDQIASSICIVMESGVTDMLQYFSERKDIPQSEKLYIVQQLLDIVAAARKCSIVLFDFKLSNVVRVSDGKYDMRLKAIDFENSRTEGEEISAETTAAYSSPEVAKMILARGRGEECSLVASHKMDVMALGFAVFELANNMSSFWKSRDTPITSDVAILEALACLQDEDVIRSIDNAFRGDQYGPLRSWLKHALRVHPSSRASCEELLHAHSLFGSKDRTLDQNSLINQLGNRIDRGVEKVIVNADTNANMIRNLLAAMSLKLDAIHAAQEDVTFVMRQIAFDSSTNHLEMKASLSSLGAGFSREFADLEKMNAAREGGVALSEEHMRGVIQTAVQAAMTQINAAGLDPSIKEVQPSHLFYLSTLLLI
jgi:serine/threonine protein kinase